MSNNTGPVEKVLSLLSTQLLHKATRTDTDNLPAAATTTAATTAATEHDEHDDDVNHGIIVESWGISNNHLAPLTVPIPLRQL